MDLALSELEECISGSDPIAEAIDQMTLTTAIDSFLHNQTQERRMIFVRRYWYLSSIEEIARDYGMSLSKTTSLLFRMRKELKEYLEKEGIHL